MLSNTKSIFQEFRQKQHALGAFNFCNAEILRGICEAAGEAKSSVVVATSESEAKFIGFSQARALVDAWQADSGLDLILHLDHQDNFHQKYE